LTKKKPIHFVRDPHGEGNWITAIAALRFRMMFVSGSNNGEIRFWAISEEHRIVLKHVLEIEGFVNDLRFSEDGTLLAVQISQEQRFGKWLPSIQKARQGVYIIKIEEIHS
jgi:ribosomal RNA-processing protein 9